MPESTHQPRESDEQAFPAVNSLPENWRVEQSETTAEGTRHFMLSGEFSKSHTSITKTIIVHHPPNEEEWEATRLTHRGQDDELVATGALETVADAAVEAACDVNNDYLSVDMITLPGK
ncbi:hypothetical protein [Salinibaculum rarum]|uniref:hypothetical protein n=1 Tax=Salinibaculum rarum TaxID=3058903 RepID=UPI00265F62E8|nr:hypothetical protein [Salinibaculum sp. KK48]